MENLKPEYRMSDLIARLEAASHKICRDGALGMESVALLLHEAAKELSALRDQQPVAWKSWQATNGITWDKDGFFQLKDGAPLYAHPSCVSPDKL